MNFVVDSFVLGGARSVLKGLMGDGWRARVRGKSNRLQVRVWNESLYLLSWVPLSM